MFHLALKIILYDKIRSLITLVGVVFAVALIFTQLGIYLGLMETASVIIDHTAGDIWVTSKNSKNFDFSQPFPEHNIYKVLSVEGVKDAENLIVVWNIMKQKEGGTEQIEVVGYNPDTGIGGPWRMREGHLRAVKNGNYAILDRSSMRRLGGFEVGQYREVGNRRLQISGISEGAKSFTTAPIIFTSYGVAQSLRGLVPPGNTVFIVAEVIEGYPIKKVVARLKDIFFNKLDVYTKAEFSRKTRLYWTIETGVGFSFLITILICFLIGMLIVGQTIYNSTMEYLKEFGTMKAIGATNFDIYKIVFAEAFINAVFGYITGLTITLVSVRIYQATEMVFSLKVWVAVLVFILTLLMCFVAAFISVRKIRKIDPAMVFRG